MGDTGSNRRHSHNGKAERSPPRTAQVEERAGYVNGQLAKSHHGCATRLGGPDRARSRSAGVRGAEPSFQHRIRVFDPYGSGCEPELVTTGLTADRHSVVS